MGRVKYENSKDQIIINKADSYKTLDGETVKNEIDR